MDEKAVPPPSLKSGVEEPAEIAFDFEDMIATAVAAVTLKKASQTTNYHRAARSLLGA